MHRRKSELIYGQSLFGFLLRLKQSGPPVSVTIVLFASLQPQTSFCYHRLASLSLSLSLSPYPYDAIPLSFSHFSVLLVLLELFHVALVALDLCSSDSPFRLKRGRLFHRWAQVRVCVAVLNVDVVTDVGRPSTIKKRTMCQEETG